MDAAPVIAVSVVVALVVMSIAFRQFAVHIKLKDVVDVELTATRKKEESDIETKSVTRL